MGSYAGHVLPGSIFIIFGLWWWFNILAKIAKAQLNYFKRRSLAQQVCTEKFDFELDFESSVWMKVPLPCLRDFPAEPCLKVIGCTVGIIAVKDVEKTSKLLSSLFDWKSAHGGSHFDIVAKETSFIHSG